MQKATATYCAPQGDSKVVEMGGLTFFDGQPIEINSNDHPNLMAKLPNNQHFEIEMGEEDEARPRRGRPPKEKPPEAEPEAS